MEVLVSKDVLYLFRRRAIRRYPKEYIETIWGRVKEGKAHIFAFHPLEHTATRNAIYDVDEEELHSQGEEEAPEHKLELLGTIHTHPDGDCCPSSLDWESKKDDKEIISGICQILRDKETGRRTTKTVFFFGGISSMKVRIHNGVRS